MSEIEMIASRGSLGFSTLLTCLTVLAVLASCGPQPDCTCPEETCPEAEPCECPECEECLPGECECPPEDEPVDPEDPQDPCEIDPDQEGCQEESCPPPDCGEMVCGRAYNDCDEWIECGQCAEDEVCEEGSCRPPLCPETELVVGEATYYAADGSGNCSYPTGTGMPFVAAASPADYADAALCGACIDVQGPDGAVLVQVVDSCPGCSAGHLDLSREAFQEIAPLSDGLVSIEWRVVPCDFDEPVSFFWESGSDQWWSSVQVRGHRNPVAAFEVRGSDGSFYELERKSWNTYFMTSMGTGPFDFRLTDTFQNSFVETGVALSPGSEVQGSGQFPICRP